MTLSWPVKLTLVCAAAMLFWLVRLGWSHGGRRRGLARAAHQAGLQFSPDDAFGITRRYGQFALPAAGHSPRAENVVSGRLGRWNIRAFDFYFEVGHGPRRVARRYCALAADGDCAFPPALLWHAEDGEHVPLAATMPEGQAGPWRVVEGGDFAAALAEAMAPFRDEVVHVQSRQRSVMLCWPARCAPSAVVDRANRLGAAMERLARDLPPGAPAARTDGVA